jgi:ankyrin repeat protein
MQATDAGEDVNIRNNDGRAALWWAARNGYGMVMEDCSRGMALTQDINRRTALSWATGNGSEQVVQEMLRKDWFKSNFDVSGIVHKCWSTSSDASPVATSSGEYD